MVDQTFGKIDKTDLGAVKLEALLNYIKMGNIDMAFDQAYSWIKDGSLTLLDFRKFVSIAAHELIAKEKRQEFYRG